MVQAREHGGWSQDICGEVERRDELGIQVWNYCWRFLQKKPGPGPPDKAGSSGVTVLLLALNESWPCQGTETLPGRPPYHP